MKKIKLILMMIHFVGVITAQYESDRLVMGGTIFSSTPTVPFRNSIIYFNEHEGIDSIDATQYLNIGLYSNASSSSTWSRDTVMYVTNGYRIVNQRGQIIDPKILSPAFSDGMPGQLAGGQNVIFLSIKHDEIEKLYLFYGEYGYKFPDSQSGRLDTLFSYAELNPLQSWPSTTALISKNNVLLGSNDTTQNGGISACRHANGRDWWILKPGMRANEFYRFLLSPYGIQMNKYYSNVDPVEVIKGTVYTHFNILGNKYAYYVPAPGPKRVYLYDFDRCNGELSNPEIHVLTEWLNPFEVNINCLSPDGSKLYIFRQPMNSSQQPGIIQYDFETQQANYLGRDARIPFVSPNGKEIILHTAEVDSTAPLNIQPYFSIIRNPNDSWSNLHIDWDEIKAGNFIGLVPPNLAYYRLGAAEGTVCDSLGLSSVAEVNAIEINIFPNPSSGVVNLRLAQWPGGSYSLHNSLGQQVAQASLPATGNEQMFTLAFRHLPNGLYFLSLHNPQGQMLGSKRLMIRRE